MNIYISKALKYFFIAITITFSSCETLDVEVENDPNNLAPEQADIDFFLNATQIGLAEFISGKNDSNFSGISRAGMEPVRMLNGGGGTYRSMYSPGDFTLIWETAYAEILADIKTMIPLAEASEQYTHVAIGQIIESYVMLTLVDYFGEVPFSEALDGTNFNPAPDSGESIYEAVDTLLLDAITNLNRDEISGPTNDLFYDGDESKWIKLANTLRLKLYLQARLANTDFFNESTSTSVINSLIANGNLILSSDDDFQFQWSTNSVAPDSRHPFFEKTFNGAGPSSNFYFSNYYMNLMANTYSIADPRTRYYFYRQTGDFSSADVVTKECVTQGAPSWYSADDIYCTVPNTNGFDGLWGRNHLDSDGIPPDDQFRTVFGVYPVGGPFDDDSFRNMVNTSAPNEGLSGAGITPIMLSSYTNFMLAEASLELGTTGSARVYLENGIDESITKTIDFGASVASSSEDPSLIPTTADIDTYKQEVLSNYDTGDQMEIIVQQYFIALWTNGIEAFNTYRRTGYPNNLSPSIEVENPGTFIRSHFYPENAANNNSSIDQKSDVNIPVFWDTNPEGFVN